MRIEVKCIKCKKKQGFVGELQSDCYYEASLEGWYVDKDWNDYCPKCVPKDNDQDEMLV